MTNAAARTAPATNYAVVMDGHTANETLAMFAIPGRFTRAKANKMVDAKNAEYAAMGIVVGWHSEFMG